MAGSYLHLHLASRAFARAFGDGASPAARAAFAAGSLAPDLGFFPGGPSSFSRHVHHEHTADLVRALLGAAHDEVETAFGAGWALHVCTDVATHPVVNHHAEVLRRAHGRQPPERLDLWHKRVEWGLDCHVLTSIDARPLWRDELLFPLRGDGSLLTHAARDLFAEDASDEALRAGWESTRRWVSRLGPIFCWTGACRSPSRSRGAAVLAALLRPLARSAGRVLESRPDVEDEVAILSPSTPSAALVHEMMSAGESAVVTFHHGWQSRFADLPNLDLDTGEAVDSP